MKDKTQLEQLKEILTFVWEKGVVMDITDNEEIAHQILDLCQPKWTPLNEHHPYDIHRDIKTRKRVIFKYFEGGDYWSLEPEPPGESE